MDLLIVPFYNILFVYTWNDFSWLIMCDYTVWIVFYDLFALSENDEIKMINQSYGVSNHQQRHDCLLNHSFRGRSNKSSKLRVTGPCAGNSPVTGEFSAQIASNPENISIWWRHHDIPILFTVALLRIVDKLPGMWAWVLCVNRLVLNSDKNGKERTVGVIHEMYSGDFIFF